MIRKITRWSGYLITLIALPAFADDGIRFSGYLLADADYFDSFYVKAQSDDSPEAEVLHGEIRALKGTIKWKENNFRLKTQYVLRSEGSEWGDLIASYKSNSAEFYLGRSEPATSQEANMSYKKLPVIERSLPVRAFAADTGNIAGINWQPQQGKQQWQVSLFQDDDNHQAVQLRFSQVLLSEHLTWAIAGESRQLNNDLYQLKIHAGAHLSDKVIRSPRFYADSQTLLQTEVNAINSLGWFAAEYWLTRTTADNEKTFTFQGSYWQWVYNTHSSYRIKDLEVDSKGKQLTGSWDYILRLELLDLQDYNYGSRATNLLAGINYHPGKNISLMANLIHSQAAGQLVTSEGIAEQAQGNMLSVRLRYLF